jgi:hypothetical protein
VVRADQSGQLDWCADLLEALASRGNRRVFVVVDEATGQAPETLARLDRAAPQHDPAIGLDDHARRYLRVMPQNKAVIRARLNLAAFDDSRHECGAAVDAEVAHPPKVTCRLSVLLLLLL